MFVKFGVEYDGSTHASGACRLGSIPSTPTKLNFWKWQLVFLVVLVLLNARLVYIIGVRIT